MKRKEVKLFGAPLVITSCYMLVPRTSLSSSGNRPCTGTNCQTKYPAETHEQTGFVPGSVANIEWRSELGRDSVLCSPKITLLKQVRFWKIPYKTRSEILRRGSGKGIKGSTHPTNASHVASCAILFFGNHPKIQNFA